MTKQILEYQALRRAVDLFNDTVNGAGELAKNPALAELLAEVHRAQDEDDG